MNRWVVRCTRGGVALVMAVGLGASAGGAVAQAARHSPHWWRPKPQKVKVLPRIPLRPVLPSHRLPKVPEGVGRARQWPAAGSAEVTLGRSGRLVRAGGLPVLAATAGLDPYISYKPAYHPPVVRPKPKPALPPYNPQECMHLGINCSVSGFEQVARLVDHSHMHLPDYYTFGFQACVIVCIGETWTVDRYGKVYFNLNGGIGLGFSVGGGPGFIRNSNPQYHTKTFVNKSIKGFGSAISAGLGPIGVTDTGDGNAAQIQPAYGWAPEGVDLKFGFSWTWGYTWQLGSADRPYSKPPYVYH